MLKATVEGLQSLRRPEDVAAARGLTISQVLPAGAKPEPEETLQQTVTSTEEPVEEPAQETDSGEGQDQADA
jgi:hypothetical protein